MTSSVPARVGLVGNPSDGFGGAVLATVVPSLAAQVRALPASHIALQGVAWATPVDWWAHVHGHGHGGEDERVISAALWVTQRHLVGRHVDRIEGVELSWRST